MSPDSPHSSRQRKAWRVLACLGCVLGAFSLFASVVLNTRIQSSREDALRQVCLEQNARHDRTVRTLDEEMARRLRQVGPSERVRLRASRAGTIALIDTLAPHQNCTDRARRLAE